MELSAVQKKNFGTKSFRIFRAPQKIKNEIPVIRNSRVQENPVSRSVSFIVLAFTVGSELISAG